MKMWYYHDGVQQKGPIPEDDFAQLFQSGQLTGQTLVWTEGFKEWTQARNVENLVPLSPDPPPIAPPQQALPPISTFAATGRQVRPWVRYWARMLDVTLFSIIMGVVIAPFHGSLFRVNEILLGMAILFTYVFVEPCMLSSWGTTPGKALLNIRVRKNNGDKPTYAEAITRALNVWTGGLGLGIPIVALFAQIYAYNRLTKDKITSWDKEGGFTVSHRVIGTGRIVATILIFLPILFLVVLGQAGNR